MNDPFFAAVFYLFSAALIVLALITVFAKRVFHGAMALSGALALVGAIFALLGADFLAGSQLLIYVGGIMILMLFVIMFSQGPFDRKEKATNSQALPAAVAALTIASLLIMRFYSAYSGTLAQGAHSPTTHALGRFLLKDWRLPFEVVSLVLLAALVGAVMFSHKGPEEPG